MKTYEYLIYYEIVIGAGQVQIKGNCPVQQHVPLDLKGINIIVDSIIQHTERNFSFRVGRSDVSIVNIMKLGE